MSTGSLLLTLSLVTSYYLSNYADVTILASQS